MTQASDNLAALTDPETQVVSFVLRFVGERAPAAGQAAAEWHGVLRHVQSNAELQFTRWEAAVAFIAQHVDLAAGRNP